MKYAKPEWHQGQPFSTEFNDVYFSAENGLQETEYVFIQHNQLLERFEQLQQPHFVIAETGFGTGLNFLVTARAWLQQSQASHTLYYYSAESTPFCLADLISAHQAWPELQVFAEELHQHYEVASYGFHRFSLFAGRVVLVLMVGDVQAMLAQMSCHQHSAVDAWFLDGFAPSLNPDMWQQSVCQDIQRLSKVGTTLSTYTAVGEVRRNLQEVGFTIDKVAGHGKKRHMLRGEMQQACATSSHAECQGNLYLPWFECASTERPAGTICIIGAGIAGLSTAWSLVQRGFSVTVIDASEAAGMQASGNPRAMIMPRLSLQDAADAEFYTSAYFYALRCLQVLDVQQQSWQPTGGIQLPSSARILKQIEDYPQTASLAQAISIVQASEYAGVDLLSDIGRQELTADSRVHYFSKAACVYPQKVLQQLIEAMGDSLTLMYGQSVCELSFENEQWSLFDNEGRNILNADTVVVAAGWQSKHFEPVEHMYLQPARGQLTLLEASEQSAKLKVPLCYSGYLLPADQQGHVVGASFELDDCCSELREEEDQQNLQDMQHWFSHTDQHAVLGARASVRGVTPDRIPIVGPAPLTEFYQMTYGDLYKGKPTYKYPTGQACPGLFINTGHGARGFTSAFLSAEYIAALIAHEPLPVSNRVRYALHPARFLIRSYKKKKFNL